MKIVSVFNALIVISLVFPNFSDAWCEKEYSCVRSNNKSNNKSNRLKKKSKKASSNLNSDSDSHSHSDLCTHKVKCEKSVKADSLCDVQCIGNDEEFKPFFIISDDEARMLAIINEDLDAALEPMVKDEVDRFFYSMEQFKQLIKDLGIEDFSLAADKREGKVYVYTMLLLTFLTKLTASDEFKRGLEKLFAEMGADIAIISDEGEVFQDYMSFDARYEFIVAYLKEKKEFFKNTVLKNIQQGVGIDGDGADNKLESIDKVENSENVSINQLS